MKETTAKLLERAQDAIEAADILLTNGKVDIAGGRASLLCYVLYGRSLVE